MDSDLEPESKLMSLISELISLDLKYNRGEVFILTTQIILLVRSMDLESQPKPESELMSLLKQTISVFNSMDLESQSKPLSELVSFFTKRSSCVNLLDLELKFKSLVEETLSLDPEPELLSFIYQICSIAISLDSRLEKFISLRPEVVIRVKQGEFHVIEEVTSRSYNKWDFLSRGCNGKNYEGYEEAPSVIKHPLHPIHSLQLFFLKHATTMQCYCCDDYLHGIVYCCLACNLGMNIACVEKPRVLSITLPVWHEHTLAQFPTQDSLTCKICFSIRPTCPFYICPPCDFVVHHRCINLPHVIRISRHPHRICFAYPFDQEDRSCGVCRKKINNDYGGYYCNKCPYVAHSKCATQSSVWDGTELEGVPEVVEEKEEDDEEEMRISAEIILHFSHQHHYLRLDVNTGRDYDENKQCQACSTPIYFGSFYYCMQCDYILHDVCAKLPLRTYNMNHPHRLALVRGNQSVMNDENRCSVCPWWCTTGFFYKCTKEGCPFKLHVQCVTISEPLVHASHIHPLFLTSKPEERRTCSVCIQSRQTFNCIECDFVLCFECATLPQTVMYKYDKHMLRLCYGEETAHWCEVCEGKINPYERFYMCEEYCCVTLHIECIVGKDLYMNPGSSWLYHGTKVGVQRNNHHMTRPICSYCKKRCPHKIVFQCFGSIFCSVTCSISFTKIVYFQRVANAIA